MKKLIIILLAYTMCVASLAAIAQQAVTLSNTKLYEQELTKLLNSLNDVTGVPGFSVAVVHKGKLVASVATGLSDVKNKRTATPNTTFRLASVSKIIGATMLAELVTTGQLDPDLGIGHYYPDLNIKYHHITIRHLVSHISGMPHYQLKDFDIYDHHFERATDAVKTLKNRDLLSRPGAKYEYSTHGYTLAGAVYEKVTNQSLSHGVKQFVERWTGKATPAIENLHQLSPDSSKLYELGSNGAKEITYGEKSYSVFGAGLYATASDLAYFGAKVLEKSNSQPPLKKLLFSPTKKNDGSLIKNSRYSVGFGWRIAQDQFGRTVYHHAGATPGARSILALFPEHNLSIAFLSNSSWISGIDKLVFALASLYIDEAKVDEKTQIKLRISNKNDQIESFSNCTANQCYLTDSKSDFATWLNSFNTKSNTISKWPIFTYNTPLDQRLLMVTKIGITSFKGLQNRFEANTGKHQTYSIQITEKNNLK